MVRRGVVLGVLLTVFAAGAADAVKTPVYRYPTSFKPPKRPPAAAPAPGQPSVPLSSTGAFPDMVIDAAGTAHIVWTEGRGDQADVVVYCRLRRGAKACSNPRTELAWDKSYGTGDGPQFNTDNGGPRIVLAGDQLIVLDKRYPTVGVKPDGSSSSTLVAWASNDGGQIWSKPAAILGKYDLGQAAVLVKGAEQSVLNFGFDPLCPGMCVEEYTSGAYTGGGRDFSTGPNQNYSGTLAIGADGIPTIGFADLSNHVLLRRWKGTGDVMDPATWSASATVSGEQPALAGGPSGTFLMSKPGPGKGFEVRAITPDAAGVPTAGTATTVSGADDTLFNRLYEDPTGRLYAAWEQRGGKDPGVKLRVATPAAGARRAGARAIGAFDTAQTLVAGAGNGQIALGATPDGGGFTVLNHTGGVNAPGEIVADGFGSQLNTGAAGLGDLEGGGDPSPACQTVNFGSFDIQAASGCFIHGKGVDARKVITTGVVDLYGLKLQADAGSKLVIDPTKLQILTYGQAKVWVEIGSERFVLWHGDLDIDLNRLKPGDPLFDFDPNKFTADFFGFPSGADIKVFLQGNGVHVKVGLKLPSAFLGVNGDVDLVADRETGVHLDSFRIAIPNVALGAVEFRDFELKYNFGLKTWVGKGTLAIAKAGAIAASATFAGGDFKGASIDYQLPAPLPIGPFVYLKRVGGGFMTDPVKIDVTGTIGAGVPVGGEFPITVDGHAGMEFPSEGGAKFQIDGKVYVLLLEVAEGRLRFQIAPGGGGYADFFVQSNQDFEIMSFNAKLEGWVDGRDDSPTKGQMAGDFHGQVCINFVIGCLLKGSLDAAISQKGLAVCGSVSVEDVGFSAGVQFTLDGLRSATETMAETPGIFAAAVGTGIVLAHFHIRCHASDFRVPPPVARSAQAGGGVGLDVPGGLPTESFLVYGDGGVPNVDVVGPGATVAGTAPGEKASKSADGDALAFAPVNAVLVTVEHPKAGTWTVQPRPGSPAIKQVKLSDGYRPAKPAATVVKGRSLRYTIADLGAGQTVRFVESGKFGHRILGDAKSATGSFALPQDGLAAGKRTITALVQHAGLTTDRSVVARYVAPGPAKPARVRSIRVKRSGTTLSARWPAAKGAVRYVVTVHGGKRLGLGRIVAGKHVSFDLVPRGVRVTVTVTGLSKDLVRGRARTVRSR